MSQQEKLLQRIQSKPKDFTWSELKRLLEGFGYRQEQGSGSSRKFIHSEGRRDDLYARASSAQRAEGLPSARRTRSFEAGRLSMTDRMEYKGYLGSVHFSAEDEVFHGQLEGIRDLVTYEGTAVGSLRHNFRNAVDEYLTACSENHREPQVPFKGSFNVRIGSELHKRAATYAAEHRKKLNTVVTEALERYLQLTNY